MQVSVACMENVEDQKFVALGDLVHLGEHLGEAPSRHHGVVQVIVRLDARDRPERRFAPLPEEESLRLVLGHPDASGAVLPTDLYHPSYIGIETHWETGDLHEQHRGSVEGQTGMHEGLDRLDTQTVHHLERRREDPAGNDGRHGVGPVVHAREVHEECPHGRRVLGEPNTHLGRDAEHALAAYEHAAQVVARWFGVLATEHRDGPVRKHDLKSEDVGVGHAVRKTMRSAGIVRHVPADGTTLLTRGIRREVQTLRRGEPREIEVEHTRLHPRHAVLDIHTQYLVHLRERDHHCTVERDRPTGEAGARSPRDEGDTVANCRPYTFLDLSGRGGQADDGGGARDVRCIACVQHKFCRASEHPVGAEHTTKFTN
ncbi:unannotated protein [freshwater metagenome]|uniref:Unannotated protein n=1 Tax=freshwater metagenome TaxID=449393 RepID=A0A6J7EFX8_9ZZZZ